MSDNISSAGPIDAPLKILIIVNSIDPEGRVGIGGAERTAIDIATHCNRSIIEPAILTYESPGESASYLKTKNIAVHSVVKRWKLDPLIFPSLHKLISSKKIDAVLSVNTGANLDSLIVTRKLERVACLIRVPSVRVKFRVMMTEGRMANRADALIVPSVDAEKVISKQYRILKSRIRVIPNGCDGKRFTFVPYFERIRFRRELGLPEDALVLYTPSRVHSVKGQDIFAEALSQISPYELRAKKLLWVNTGRIQDAKLAERIQSITREISDHVRLLPPSVDTAKWFAACDWVVIPSRIESFGLSMLEAAFVGRPMYASRCGIAKELDEIHNGLTFNVSDVKSALEGLRRVISTNIEERITIAEKLNEHFRPVYSIESTVRQYEQAIIEAVNRRRSM